jgi:serralysin
MSARKPHAALFGSDDDDGGTQSLDLLTLIMGTQSAHDFALFKAAAKPSGGGQTADPAYLGVDSGALWTPALTAGSDPTGTITASFSFPNAASDYGKGYSETSKFVAFNATEISKFLSVPALANSYMANLNLVGVAQDSTADSTADMRIAKTVTQGADAWAYYPALNKGGDVWFNRNDAHAVYGGKGGMNWDPDHQNPGDYTYTVYLHEFGHALGLKHSFESGGVAGAVPKVLDTLEYTVMGYDAYQDPNDSTVDQRNWWADDGNNPQTYMQLDIAALQYMYGADYGTNNGNTTYAWNQTTGALTINGTPGLDAPLTNNIFMTIWDGGGTDTYDFSGYTNPVSIDLQPGHWVAINDTNLADPQRADLLAGTGEHWATGNIANALIDPKLPNETASLIENAIGGAGADTFIGNVKDNSFTGNGGADVFVFNSLIGLDTITDFASALDKLAFDHTIFTALGAIIGALPSDDFYSGSAAHDANDYIVYDPSNGKLFYDADGDAAASPVQIALLSVHPGLADSDILIA